MNWTPSRHRIALEVITPTHIGSGKALHGNAEYIWFGNERVCAIIDDAKILQILGPDRIDLWINAVEKPERISLIEVLKRFKSDITSDSIAQRVLSHEGTLFPRADHPLREFIRTGTNHNYIPGSSIKGAIRTALFSVNMKQEKSVDEAEINANHNNNRRPRYTAAKLEKRTFGSNPNEDLLRFLRVADFSFPNHPTQSAFAQTFNMTRLGRRDDGSDDLYEIKDSVKQLLEYLPVGSRTTGSISISANQRKQFLKKNSSSHSMVFDLPELFERVNRHTAAQLRSEIDNYKYADLPDSANLFVDHLKDLLDQLEQLSSDSCLLRLGFATGLRNMTGGWWTETLSNEPYDNLSDQVRPLGYNNFPLPKSRRFIFDGQPMGFIKLTYS